MRSSGEGTGGGGDEGWAMEDGGRAAKNRFCCGKSGRLPGREGVCPVPPSHDRLR